MEQEVIKFLKNSILFIFIFILTFIIYLFILNTFSRTPNIERWISGTIQLKDKMILEKKSPKIIIIGGSDAFWGISARTIEEEMNISSFNYGINAGLGDYIFEGAKGIVKSGDIILAQIVYPLYWYNKKILFGKQDSKERYILTHDREYFNKLHLYERLNILVIGGIDLVQNIKYQTVKPYEPLRVETVDEWGDETANLYSQRKNFSVAKPTFVFPDNFKDKFSKYDGVIAILKFAEWTKKNNITFIVTYTPTVYFSIYDSEDYQEGFRVIEEFYQSHNITVIGKPKDMFYYEKNFFDDGTYHLNDIGRDYHTKFILKGLKKVLNNSAKISH